MIEAVFDGSGGGRDRGDCTRVIMDEHGRRVSVMLLHTLIGHLMRSQLVLEEVASRGDNDMAQKLEEDADDFGRRAAASKMVLASVEEGKDMFEDEAAIAVHGALEAAARMASAGGNDTHFGDQIVQTFHNEAPGLGPGTA